MNRKDFVVGKKYLQIGFANDAVVECTYNDGVTIVVKRENGVSWPIYNENHYTPYVEKKRGTVWVNVYNTGELGHWWKSRDEADVHAQADYKSRIACIEVPWIEGQGLEKSKT